MSLIKPTDLDLTYKEIAILYLMSDGMRNSEIAVELYISTETVKTHVQRILYKLSAKNRTHAVAIAFRSGMLPVSPQ